MMSTSTIVPIRNFILFQFEDEHIQSGIEGKTHLREKTNWGFEVGLGSAYDSTAKTPRWIRVLKVGNDVPNDIQPGMRVLVEPLKWTSGVKFNGEMCWRTDSDQIIAVDDSA